MDNVSISDDETRASYTIGLTVPKGYDNKSGNDVQNIDE